MDRRKEIEILVEAGSTRSEAKYHLDRGTIVYGVADFLEFFEEYTQACEPEDKERIRSFVEEGKDGVCGDYAMVTYDGAQYLIEYVL